jgi:hypothetical protein
MWCIAVSNTSLQPASLLTVDVWVASLAWKVVRSLLHSFQHYIVRRQPANVNQNELANNALDGLTNGVFYLIGYDVFKCMEYH